MSQVSLSRTRSMRKSVRAVMALRKQIVNGRFSFGDRARWRGKFIYPSWLAKLLSNISFSLHPGMIRSTKLFYRREIDPRLNPRVGIKSRNSDDLKRHRGGSSREPQSEIWSIQAPNSALTLPTSSISVLESSRNSRPKKSHFRDWFAPDSPLQRRVYCKPMYPARQLAY